MVVAIANSNGTNTIKFLYSYGGKILPRHTDGKLRYVGGHTRVLSVERRSISFAELLVKFGELCGTSVNLRCKLPTEDLDTLISITCDEDLANIIEEYDRAASLSHSRFPPKIVAVLAPPISLKTVSPPPSSTSSFNQDHHSFESSYAVPKATMPYSYPRLRTQLPVGIPVGYRADAVKAPYYPCYIHRNPRPVYFVQGWN